MNRKEIDSLLHDIRKCTYCGNKDGNTPFIYSGPEPKLMVVSDVPHRGSFEKNIRQEWGKGMNNEGTPRTLFKWLDLDFEKAKRITFWIQRMNCAFVKGDGLELARSDCSPKFIPQAIKSVTPELIITIGRPAAELFFGGQFRLFSEIIGEKKKYVFEDLEIPFIAFLHPSGANRRWHSENAHQLEKAKTLAREIVKNF